MLFGSEFLPGTGICLLIGSLFLPVLLQGGTDRYLNDPFSLVNWWKDSDSHHDSQIFPINVVVVVF